MDVYRYSMVWRGMYICVYIIHTHVHAHEYSSAYTVSIYVSAMYCQGSVMRCNVVWHRHGHVT